MAWADRSVCTKRCGRPPTGTAAKPIGVNHLNQTTKAEHFENPARTCHGHRVGDDRRRNPTRPSSNGTSPCVDDVDDVSTYVNDAAEFDYLERSCFHDFYDPEGIDIDDKAIDEYQRRLNDLRAELDHYTNHCPYDNVDSSDDDNGPTDHEHDSGQSDDYYARRADYNRNPDNGP